MKGLNKPIIIVIELYIIFYLSYRRGIHLILLVQEKELITDHRIPSSYYATL